MKNLGYQNSFMPRFPRPSISNLDQSKVTDYFSDLSFSKNINYEKFEKVQEIHVKMISWNNQSLISLAEQ